MKQKGFMLNEIFEAIITGEYHVSSALDDGPIPLVSCKAVEQGIEGYFDIPMKDTYSNCITISCDGQPLTSFYHDYPIAAKDNVLICIPKKGLKLPTVYYIVATLNKLQWRFSYGRKFYSNKIDKIQVRLPVKSNGEIDQEYISSQMKIRFKDNLLKDASKKFTDKRKVGHFQLNESSSIVSVERKYALYMNELTKKSMGTPYVTTSESDNGISMFSDEKPNFKGESLTVSLDGKCGTTFFQFEDFMAGEKTAVITTKNSKNPHLLFYIGALIRLKSWRYHYGRKLSEQRLRKLVLPLPQTQNGEIDLDYIKNLVESCYGWRILEKNLKS